jgi:hypothetical protein
MDAIWFIGVSAALNQIEVAPEIVNGVFYAMLALVVGVAIVAIGGGGIQPMRQRWERALNRGEQEAPRARQQAQASTSPAPVTEPDLRQQPPRPDNRSTRTGSTGEPPSTERGPTTRP